MRRHDQLFYLYARQSQSISIVMSILHLYRLDNTLTFTFLYPNIYPDGPLILQLTNHVTVPYDLWMLSRYEIPMEIEESHLIFQQS